MSKSARVYARLIFFTIILLSIVVSLFSSDTLVAQAIEQDNSRVKINIIYCGKEFTYNDNIIQPSNHMIAVDLFNRGHNLDYQSKVELLEENYNISHDCKKALNYIFPNIDIVVNRVKNYVYKESKNSTISFNPHDIPMFKITRENDGRRIDEQLLYSQIYGAVKKSCHCKIFVSHKIVSADIKANDMVKCTNMISKFSTDFSHGPAGRKHNIELALSKINGTRIDSREMFSFNNIVGDRSEENGYEDAKVIIDGKLVDGVGGGVCQVSTTLYNSSIRAGMDIVEVKNHTFPTSYIAPSMDAMVTSKYSDLKFSNKFDTPVFIRAYASGEHAVIEFYGAVLPYTIQLESQVTEVKPAIDEEFIDIEHKYFDHTGRTGDRMRIQELKHGGKSEGYLLKYDRQGNLIERKLIRKDVYKPQNGKIAVCP